MKYLSASSTWPILFSMLPLTSRASAMRIGCRSLLKSVIFCRLPFSRTLKFSPSNPSTGSPLRSRTDTGTRTVRAVAAKVGSWVPGREDAVCLRNGRDDAGGTGGAGRRRQWPRPREMAATSVSLAPASRTNNSLAVSSGAQKPRPCSSVITVRSLMPARR